MILRRLTNALKEQNWTTILIEFVLLVSGVFLGIQAAIQKRHAWGLCTGYNQAGNRDNRGNRNPKPGGPKPGGPKP
jgi:hypothetical protein